MEAKLELPKFVLAKLELAKPRDAEPFRMVEEPPRMVPPPSVNPFAVVEAASHPARPEPKPEDKPRMPARHDEDKDKDKPGPRRDNDKPEDKPAPKRDNDKPEPKVEPRVEPEAPAPVEEVPEVIAPAVTPAASADEEVAASA